MEGLDVEDDGTVTSEAGADDLTALLDQYRSIMKGGADAHAREAIKDLYHDDRAVIDLDIPDNLLPREARAEKFASAL